MEILEQLDAKLQEIEKQRAEIKQQIADVKAQQQQQSGPTLEGHAPEVTTS